MPGARALFAVLLGFSIVTFGALSLSVWGSGDPTGPTRSDAVGAALALAAFVLGGYATARLAPGEPMRHVVVVAGIGAFMTVLTMLSQDGRSGLYAAGGLLLFLVGLPAGGLLGLRHRR